MKARNTHLPLFFCTAVFFTVTSSVGALELTAPEKATLAEGKVVRRIIADNGKDRYYGGTGMAVIPEAPEVVWAAIQDFGSYPRIFSNTYEAKELSRLGGKSLIRMKLGHPIVSIKYHIEMAPDPKAWTLSFRLVTTYPNDVEDLHGYWRIVPMGKDSCMLMYVFGVKVPDGIVRILPESFKVWALEGVLSAPGAIKTWLEEKKSKANVPK